MYSLVSKARINAGLSQAALKAIAKITGVTQKSLLETPKGASASTATKKTTSSSKTTEELKLTSAEKTLVKLYRAADSDTKKAAVSVLKGEATTTGGLLSSILDGVLDTLSNHGKKYHFIPASPCSRLQGDVFMPPFRTEKDQSCWTGLQLRGATRI